MSTTDNTTDNTTDRTTANSTDNTTDRATANGTEEYAADVAALEAGVAAPGPGSGRVITALAGGLWLVVGALLTYGITLTVIKAAALFTS